MAQIQTATNEDIIQVKSWLGVNEAPDGEAMLKTGEAAAMRNFKVTNGGALQKRPGSRNVAGLLAAYTTYVSEDVEQFTRIGADAALTMYPRLGANSVGVTVGEGDAVSVSPYDPDAYVGYYWNNGRAYQFLDVQAFPVTGDIAINGGAAMRGALTRIASGSAVYTDSTTDETGAVGVTAYENLTIRETTLTLDGTETVHGKPGTDVGFSTTDVGGYVEQDGVVYEYYGAKTEANTAAALQSKYNCTRSTSYYTYYTEGTWEVYGGVPSGFTAYPSYSFNSSTGKFSNVGTAVSPSEGYNGTYYYANGNTLSRFVVSDKGIIESTKTSVKKTGSRYVYSLGDYIEDVLTASGARPDADRYTYVTTTTIDSKSYTIMQDSGVYYAYCASEDTTAYNLWSYGWYGYPLTVSGDTYIWQFHPTYAEGNSSDSVVRGIWSGYVNGREVLCAACNGYLWELNESEGVWSKTACGAMDTSQDVFMFGFDEKLYVLNGSAYLVWDGETMVEVEGYRPLVTTATLPTGGGTALEQVNRLTGARRVRYSPDGETKVYQLPETGLASVDYVKNVGADTYLDDFTADLTAGTVTFTAAPAAGVNSLEIGYTHSVHYRDSVVKMRYAELYNGANDSRVFLYGDGSNQTFYSGLDNDGQARADYFPELNVAHVGDANTPVTGLIRQYSTLLAFKKDSAYAITYDTLTLESGLVTPGFYVSPVNRSMGNIAPGQVELVENRPRTLDGRSVVEWKATVTLGSVSGDQRNAERISQRVSRTIRTFDLASAKTFYDKYAHEYYVIGSDGTALVNAVDVDAWFVYTNFHATCMVVYKDEVYYGNPDGYLRHFSNTYFSDEGEAIDAYWESGAMAFGADYMRKYSAMLWVGIKPENNGYLQVTAETDRKSDFAEYSFSTDDAADVPRMNRLKLKAKKFTYYKMIFSNNTPDTTATVVSADIRVRSTGYVR